MEVRTTRNEGGWLAGALLIVLGLCLLLVTLTGAGGEAVLPVLGALFVVAYAATRRWGFLIPAALLLGLGAGVMVQTYYGLDSAPVLGLGLGFLAICAVNMAVRLPAPWWPIIPGGILVVVGATEMAKDVAAVAGLVAWWPVLLILLGVLLLIRRTPKTS